MVIWSIREYVRRWQAIVVEYVAGKPIYEIFQAKSGWRVQVDS